jgi:hypothetical protein
MLQFVSSFHFLVSVFQFLFSNFHCSEDHLEKSARQFAIDNNSSDCALWVATGGLVRAAERSDPEA